MADSCPCGHPWDEHDRAQGCWRGWVTHSEGFLYGGCECANPAPDPGPHLDKNGAPCTCVPATGESVGRFEFDGAEGIAFWVGNSDEETAVKVMFSELEGLSEFLHFNFPSLFGIRSTTGQV